jgi:hypothetical protein
MAQSRAGTAELVRKYRQTIELDPDLYDGDEDVVMWLLKDTPTQDWSPSEVARVVKTIDATEARRILEMLVGLRLIHKSGNGAWTRYMGH